MPETLYPRSLMLQLMSRDPLTAPSSDIESPAEKPVPATTTPPGKMNDSTTQMVEVSRTKNLPFINLRPVPGMRHPKPWDAVVRFFLTFQFPVVVIAVIGYSFVWYWWVLSVITMVPAAYASYTPLIQGLLFLGLLIGTVVSEVCCSGRLSDYIVGKLARRNGSVRVAEMRLWLAYPAILLTAGEFDLLPRRREPDILMHAVGLILWGVSVDKSYHWMVGQVAFFLCMS